MFAIIQHPDYSFPYGFWPEPFQTETWSIMSLITQLIDRQSRADQSIDKRSITTTQIDKTSPIASAVDKGSPI